jgi:hypothetical protein
MFVALAFAAALQTQPPVTRHYVFHTGGHATITLQRTRINQWSVTRGNVVAVRDIHSDKGKTTLRLDATSPGATAITFRCDRGGEEVWLVDVR